MCWNATVSLQTFLFSLLPLVLCYYFKLIPFPVYIFFQTFISMQLVEYFLWSYLDTPWNTFFSKIGFIVISLLPVTTILFSEIHFILVFYLCFLLYVLTYPIKFHTSIAKNKHLSWDWLRLPDPIIFLWTAFFLLPLFYTMPMFFILAVITFLISFFTYYYTNTYGSMWCWIANGTSFYLYALLVHYFLYASKYSLVAHRL